MLKVEVVYANFVCLLCHTDHSFYLLGVIYCMSTVVEFRILFTGYCCEVECCSGLGGYNEARI